MHQEFITEPVSVEDKLNFYSGLAKTDITNAKAGPRNPEDEDEDYDESEEDEYEVDETPGNLEEDELNLTDDFEDQDPYDEDDEEDDDF